MNLTIRPYEVKDAVFLTWLIVHELGFQNSTQEQIVMRLRRFHVHPDYHTLVILKDREVIGFIGLHKVMAYEFDEDYIEITALVLKKDYQVQEVGSRLIESVEAYAKKRSIKKIVARNILEKDYIYLFYQQRDYCQNGFILEKYLV